MGQNYSVMPNRVSSLSTEIESKKLLQDEQVKLASGSMALLLYYISGGNQTPKFEVTDKVRAEDQDLRGWFKEAYGANYLTRLTNSDVDDYLFTSITVNSDKVAKIKAKFDANPYGYSLRVGAINDYHIGRIVTHADNMTKYQNEAKKYAKEIATLCAKLLLGGEPPNNNIFDILHSSLRVWYGTQGKDLPVQLTNSLAVSRVIEQSKSDGTKIYADYNHTRYTYELICALFDMHCFALPKDTWVVDGTVQEILDALDGVSSAYLTQQAQVQTTLDAEIAALELEVSKKEAQPRPDAPRFTPDLKQAFQSFINSVENQGYGRITDKDRTKGPYFRHFVPIAENLQAYKDAVNNLQVMQAPAPRGLVYKIVPNEYVSLQWSSRTTNSLWYPYDQYTRELQALKDQKAAKEAELLQVTTDLTTERGKDKLLSDWHKTPAVEITKLLTGTNRSAWLDYIYNTVKTQYGLNYIQKPYGVPAQPYPRLLIPTIPGQAITTELNTIDVSRMILLYGKALQGVTPTAYWSTSLSHRLVVRPVSGASPAECQVYLHTANMRTGGVSGNSSALIATIQGDVSSAKVLVASYLPDVPFYTPGTNPTLSKPLKDSFVTKIQSDPKLSQWLRTTMKDQFHYAYVIQSAWSPQTTPPTYLLGTRTTSRTSPPYDTHIDWLRATTYAGQNHKGVTTFKPSLSTLQYDPFGNKPNSSFFQSSAGLSATRMICVGFPKSAVGEIIKFMKSVPAQIEALLKQVTDKSNSPWYEAKLRLSPNKLYGNTQTIRTDWPEYGAALPGFLNDMEILRKFFYNRTESLFISDINTVIETAYKTYKENKPEFVEDGQSAYMDVLDQHKYAELTKTYDVTNLGTVYEDYMALLGAIAYFNSFEMLTDTSYQRNYALWAKPFKSRIDAIVSRVIGSAVPQRIYEDNINDTEDVSNLHKILQSLGTFEGMSEMPVFDVEEFHFTWTPIGSQASASRDSPFDKDGLVDVPVDGLRPRAFRGLKGQYGDVFYHAITDTCVVRPNIVHSKDSGYVYSSIRVPVSTRGITSKVYGLRPGTTYGLELGTDFLPTSRLESGTGRLTNAGLASVTGLAFAGIIGYHMVKNIASETAFDDKRFRFDDVN